MAKVTPVSGFLLICVLLSVLFGTVPAQKENKEEFLEKLKKMNVSWGVGINDVKFPAKYASPDRQKKELCRKCRTLIPRSDNPAPPRFFDARNKWRRKCSKVLHTIRNQGQCDGSWAAATASLISDRMCILSEGKTAVNISAQHLLSCCKACRLSGQEECQGGDVGEAAKFWTRKGLVTGGEVNTLDGCMPYSSESFGGLALDCPSKCTNQYYSKSMENDRHKGGEMYKVPKDEKGIRQELFNSGPVLARMTVYEDLEFYKSSVYIHILGKEEGTHFVKIVGYGVEDGKKYWLIANSQGPNFGDKGYFKMLRGANHCGIEDNVVTVKLGESEPETEPPGVTDYEYEETEDPEEYEYSDLPEVSYRAAAIDDGEILEPSFGKYILLGIIFAYLYLNFCN